MHQGIGPEEPRIEHGEREDAPDVFRLPSWLDVISRLYEQYTAGAIFAQARCQHGARRARTDNQIVVNRLLHRGGRVSQVNLSYRTGRYCVFNTSLRRHRR